MPKEVETIIKLQIAGGQANPAPPVGPALGQHGLNIAEFCKKFNAETKDMVGDVIPVEITVFKDRTYRFSLKTPLTSNLLKKAAGIEKGAGNSLKEKAGKVTEAQVEEIAKTKMPDLNTKDIEAAKNIVKGTARQMGITVKKS